MQSVQGAAQDTFSPYLVLVAVLFMFAQALQMWSGAARLAGVRTRRVATGLTLFNLFATTGRLLALVYMLFIGSLADHARASHDPHLFAGEMRVVMLAAAVGAVLGGALLPSATRLLQRGIQSFERTGTLVGSLARLGRPAVMISAFGEFVAPTPSMLRHSPATLPKAFLWWNIVVMAFWVTGPLAAYDAGVLVPAYFGTAVAASGLITGVATITLTLIVDPTAALITDQAAHGLRPESDVKAMLIYIVITAFVGMLLAQLLLHPAALVIAAVAQFLNSHGVHHG